MKKIELTQNQFALVDNSDFAELNKHKWCANKYGNRFYAVRNSKTVEGKKKTILMHVEIMKTPKGFDTDHIDIDGLNNQKKNLRICTRSQNGMNKKAYKTNRSGLKGVSWCKNQNKWKSRIAVDKKTIHLGYFESKENAYEAYCNACTKYHKEYGRIK